MRLLLVPGAWMGAWIWDDMVARLAAAGHAVRTRTLPGVGDEHDPVDVRLVDHVAAVEADVRASDTTDVVLVGHSYSGVVVGQVADRLPGHVIASIHVGSFLPHDGRSLLDDWGPDPDARAAERAAIEAAGMRWAPPRRDELDGEVDLSDAQRDWLAARFVDHPGHTVLDPAALDQPVTARPMAYLATGPTGSDPLADLPPAVAAAADDGRVRVAALAGGHWPMVAEPDALLDALVGAVADLTG